MTKSAVDQALNLFSEFVPENNCKDNVRNTINDLLILSTAIDREKKFLTNDNLLNHFAAEYYEAPIHKDKDELLIDFSKQPLEKEKVERVKVISTRGGVMLCVTTEQAQKPNNRPAPERFFNMIRLSCKGYLRSVSANVRYPYSLPY